MTHSEYQHELRESIKRQAKREAEGDPIRRVKRFVWREDELRDMAMMEYALRRRPVN